jgi:ubiquinone/menaquinone biosynthesis C-methylase UbiE
MPLHICPWWLGWLIDNPLRRLIHNAQEIVGPYVRPGMTVMDVGCGRGIFSIAMARMVGDGGRVIAVDLQQQMLNAVARRAKRAGVTERVRTHKCEANRLGVEGPVDFALAFAMVHEVPDARRLLAEIHAGLKPGGRFLVAEPRLHVSARAFDATLATAEDVGFRLVEEPSVRRCRAAVFNKAAGSLDRTTWTA